MIFKVCPYCGKEYRARKQKQIFCSRACADNARKRTVEKTCATCGKTFINSKHPLTQYCSRKCAQIAKRKGTMLVCDFCGKEFYKAPSQVAMYKKVYCSNECRYLDKRQKDIIYYEKDYAYIILEKNSVRKKVLFDIEDIEKVQQYKWHLHLRKSDMRYDVCTNTFGEHSKRKYLHMTRYLMNCPNNLVVDHINHNTLDNRKSNLRNVTILENNQNRLPTAK